LSSREPRWRKGSYKDLSTECQQRFRGINLHWHDLRHEYASRLVERGVPLAQVRDLLGHASILTTERYDNQKLEALQAAVERLEGGKTFDPKIESSAEVSRIFQVPAEQRFADAEKSRRRNLQKSLTDELKDLVPVRGFATGWCVKFKGNAA
jgi:hypothetical protein